MIRESLHRRRGSRFRLVLPLLALVSGLPSCGLLPPLHYTISTLPLTVEQGWVQLPTRRWLLNPGLDLDIATFCPSATCAHEQAFVARFELSGPETGFADLLASDPVRTLSSARPTYQRRGQRAVSRADVTPLALADWRGGSVRLASPRHGTNSAYVAVIARRDGGQAWVMIAVAPSREGAIRHLSAAAE